MSLIKQLWLAIALTSLASLGGSFIVSSWAARDYMMQELTIKNLDNAQSLALSLSQLPKDPVSVELLISAQFDTGHYRRILLQSPGGEVLEERVFASEESDVPAWFVRLVALDIPPGIAQVQDGWQQYGTLSIETHVRYAYASLWKASTQLLLWFLAAALLIGLLGTLILRHITRPLGSLVAQAEAIGARRFITTTPPRTDEFRRVVLAMNRLAERVRAMLNEESRRLEQLRHQTQHDPLTGLLKREAFLKHFNAVLADHSAAAGGMLLIFRFCQLAELNRKHGRKQTDQVLNDFARQLQQLCDQQPEWECGRINAAEFALLAPGSLTSSDLTQFDRQLLNPAHSPLPAEFSSELIAAAARYDAEDDATSVLIRLDGSLAHAEQENLHQLQFAPSSNALFDDLQRWRTAIEDALARKALRLARFAVLSADPAAGPAADLGPIHHYEAPVRLELDGEWRNAGQFLPWAARLGLLCRIDQAVLDTACSLLAAEPELVGLAINLSDDAVRSYEFHASLLATLHASPELAPRLHLDVLESSAQRHPAAFRALVLSLRPLGCRIGLKHAGRHFSSLEGLHDLGLDYLKISASFNTEQPEDQSLLRGLCSLLHSIGMEAIAEQVASVEQANELATLGVDAFSACGELAAAHRSTRLR